MREEEEGGKWEGNRKGQRWKYKIAQSIKVCERELQRVEEVKKRERKE